MNKGRITTNQLHRALLSIESELKELKKIVEKPIIPAPLSEVIESVEVKRGHLTQEQREEIASLLLSRTPVPVKTIAKMYHVSTPTIYNIKRQYRSPLVDTIQSFGKS